MSLSFASAPSTAELRERLGQLGQLGASHGPRALRSGYDELDAALPGGGWPLGALTELLSDAAGIGELELLMPALAGLARAGRQIVWIAPPYLPYAPALAQRGLPLEQLLLIRTEQPRDALWATEQALRCPAIGAVLGWTAHIVDRNLRRLQLAAEAGGTLGILHRPAAAAQQPSPAALRLRLRAADEGLVLDIKKSRGGRAGLQLHLLKNPARPAPAGNHHAVALHSSASAVA